MERPDEEQLDLLLGALRAEAGRKGVSRFMAPWPPGSWGGLLREHLTAAPRRDGIYMLKALSERLDLESVVASEGGYWETDHI